MVIASWEDETGLVGATAPPSKLAARFHLPHSQLGALIAPFAAPNSPSPLEAEEEASNRPATARCKVFYSPKQISLAIFGLISCHWVVIEPFSTSSVVYAFATLFLRLTLSAVAFSYIMLIGSNSGVIRFKIDGLG
ncbi:hypothetical protein B296_00010130, partial [Ensete ventricosum]